MASDAIEAIADKSYYSGEEIVAAEQAGVAVTVSKPNTSNAGAVGRFDKADFAYKADRDAYLYPAGNWLTYHFTSELDGKMMRSYWTTACERCAIKHRCTTGKERRVRRWEHEDILDRVQKRLDDDLGKIPLRSKMVEHPFGTIKNHAPTVVTLASLGSLGLSVKIVSMQPGRSRIVPHPYLARFIDTNGRAAR